MHFKGSFIYLIATMEDFNNLLYVLHSRSVFIEYSHIGLKMFDSR
jgi:hypothetical protein